MEPGSKRAKLPPPEVLDGLLRTDAEQIAQLVRRIADRQARRQPAGRELATLDRRLAEARRRAEQRRATVPPVAYPAELPVSQRVDEIREAILRHQVVVVCGETGSGKTTQLPKVCLEAGRGSTGLIGHTQPRRIAARSVANRLSEELGVPLGAQVGFKVRFAEKGSDRGLIRVMTDGILLAEVQGDPDLLRYDTLIIDEAHERSLNIDFMLGYLKRLLPRRPDLRVIITSATIDPQSFSKFFGGAPVIEVSGRGWPIETRYRPLGADEDDDLDPGVVPGIVAAIKELAAEGGEQGDTLVFLPGEREIRDAADALSRAFGPRMEILPLFSRLSWAEQQRVFQPGAQRRVVLATNVAETSITVPRIRAVVDTGLARIGRYSARSKILRLPIEPVSQASANQRQGRCGRVGPGICVRLYSEQDFESREPFTPPEILRINLASVILQMEVLGLGAVDEFPFPDPPDTRLINDGYRLLQELEAVDDLRQVTDLGRQIARLPVDPQFGRMLAEARRFCARRSADAGRGAEHPGPAREAGGVSRCRRRTTCCLCRFAFGLPDAVEPVASLAGGSRRALRFAGAPVVPGQLPVRGPHARVGGPAGAAGGRRGRERLAAERRARQRRSRSQVPAARTAWASRREDRERRLPGCQGAALRHRAGFAAQGEAAQVGHGSDPGGDPKGLRADGRRDRTRMDRDGCTPSGPAHLRRARMDCRPRVRCGARNGHSLRADDCRGKTGQLRQHCAGGGARNVRA
jgi:hypothetical protein